MLHRPPIDWATLLSRLPADALTPLLELYGRLFQAQGVTVTLHCRGAAWRGQWGPAGAAPEPDPVERCWPIVAGELHGQLRIQQRSGTPASLRPTWVEAPQPYLQYLLDELTRRAAQQRVQDTHDQLQAMVQAAPLAVYALTFEGLVKQWNGAAETTFGLSQAQVMDAPLQAGTLHDAFAALRRSVARGQSPVPPLPVQLRQPGGDELDLLLTAAPMPGGLVGLAQPITPHEGRQHQAVQQLALLESVLAHANDSVLITEAEPFNLPGPRIVYANAAFSRTTGYSTEEVIGQTPRLLHGPRTDRKALDKIRHALERWQSVEVELVNYRKDGSEFWVELSIAPVADETGWYTHWISIQRDISERKQFAEHLDRGRAQVLELAAKNAPLPQVLARLIATLEQQFGGRRGAIVLPGEPPEVFTVHGDAEPARAAWLPWLLGPAAPGPVWRHPIVGGEGTPLGQVVLLPADPDAPTGGPNGDEQTQLDAAAQLAGLVIERYQATEALERQALYDALTSLPNRVLFERELQRALSEARSQGQTVAVGLMDLDRFKLINDTLGHSVGDALLQQVANRLRGVLRSRDTLARMGGDEFLLVLAGGEEVQSAAERLIHAFSQPFLLSGHEVFVRPSIGFSLFPSAATGSEQLLQQADTAMYQAKRRGGGYALYTPDGDERLAAMTLESALHRALERQEFVLHYQPQFDAHSGQLSGVEALLRWQHPELGLIPPAEFIPLAEVTGLIVPIGKWVLRQACQQVMQWAAPDLRVAVNLSARQFQQPDLDQTVAWALQSSGLPPHRLELELTESMLMQALEANETLQRLKVLGVRVAVDDFGTGYSNLAYLKQYPIDALKIDRSFTAGVAAGQPSSERDEALVGAVMQLAHALNLDVTVEGVETQGQLDFLRQRNCDQVQGYFTGRPQSAAAFAAMLTASPQPVPAQASG